jgi:hypothetical protein
VYNASQTNNILGGVASKDDLAAVVDALVSEISMLRYEARATAVNTSKMTKQLDRSTGEKDAMKVVIVADETV